MILTKERKKKAKTKKKDSKKKEGGTVTYVFSSLSVRLRKSPPQMGT